MRKFHDWLQDHDNNMLLENPIPAARHEAVLLGQIFGYDSHANLRGSNPVARIGAKVKNWWAGGEQSRAEQMGLRIQASIGQPNAADQAIAQAQNDHVYDNSTYRLCFNAATNTAAKYNKGAGGLTSNAKFKNFFLFSILAKCHTGINVEYDDVRDLYHIIMGTNPKAKQYLDALNDKYQDPEEWHKQLYALVAPAAATPTPTRTPAPASYISPMKKTDEYKGNSSGGTYGMILASGIVSPWNLLHVLINSSPNKVLTPPANDDNIAKDSVAFAEAYFPDFVARHKRRQNSNDTYVDKGGTTVGDFTKAIDRFTKLLSFSDNPRGSKTKVDGLLKTLIGPSAVAAIDPGSPVGKLVDHTSFYGMKTIIENYNKP